MGARAPTPCLGAGAQRTSCAHHGQLSGPWAKKRKKEAQSSNPLATDREVFCSVFNGWYGHSCEIRQNTVPRQPTSSKLYRELLLLVCLGCLDCSFPCCFSPWRLGFCSNNQQLLYHHPFAPVRTLFIPSNPSELAEEHGLPCVEKSLLARHHGEPQHPPSFCPVPVAPWGPLQWPGHSIMERSWAPDLSSVINYTADHG